MTNDVWQLAGAVVWASTRRDIEHAQALLWSAVAPDMDLYHLALWKASLEKMDYLQWERSSRRAGQGQIWAM